MEALSTVSKVIWSLCAIVGGLTILTILGILFTSLLDGWKKSRGSK